MSKICAGLAGIALAGLGCASKAPPLAPPSYEDDPAARADLVATALDGYSAAFVLAWDGQRIGEARERFYADDSAAGGWRFERIERVVVRRGDATSTARTIITIQTDAAMHARHVRVERDAGAGRRVAEATRQVDDGWRVVVDGAPARLVDGRAVPATLVPLLVAARGASGTAFDGRVLVEGAGLALARLEVTVGKDGVAAARYLTPAGELRALARLDEQGRVVEAGLGAMLSARRVTDAELGQPFAPPEIVDSSAIEVAGSPGAGGGLHLTISNVKVPPPALDELPAQTVAMAPGGSWEVTIEPTAFPEAGTGAWREVRERTAHVSAALADDLRFATFSPAEALAAGRGDCTAHAVVLAQDLEGRGYKTRLVTGYVLEDGSLRRHRWVLVRVGKRWIPVDPMFDEAPASPTHLALAVHGASADELAFIDDVVFAGWGEAIAGYR